MACTRASKAPGRRWCRDAACSRRWARGVVCRVLRLSRRLPATSRSVGLRRSPAAGAFSAGHVLSRLAHQVPEQPEESRFGSVAPRWLDRAVWCGEATCEDSRRRQRGEGAGVRAHGVLPGQGGPGPGRSIRAPGLEWWPLGKAPILKSAMTTAFPVVVSRGGTVVQDRLASPRSAGRARVGAGPCVHPSGSRSVPPIHLGAGSYP